VIALIVLGCLRRGRVQKAREELVRLAKCHAVVDSQLARRSELERQRAELLIIERIDDQLGSRVSALDLLSELQRLLSPTMALSQASIETLEVAVPVKSVAPVARSNRRLIDSTAHTGERTVKRLYLTLTGLAATDVGVANFIGQLSASPLFEDVNMGYSKNLEFDGRIARQFQASCYVVR